MKDNYNPQRTRNCFSLSNEKAFTISRTKIQNFLDCPRCFYLDRKCGTGQPPGYPFTLNVAVDSLLKKEFDFYREKQESHPLMTQYGLDAIPFSHPELDKWRADFKGLQHLHEPTNLVIQGAVDDLWINKAGELIVVDYKATSTTKEISLDEEYRQSYKNQMEVYQWILRCLGFSVSNTGYFVYCNGDSTKESFSGKLEFAISLIPYEGNDSWVEPAIFKILQCLEGEVIPQASVSCPYCQYCAAVNGHLNRLPS